MSHEDPRTTTNERHAVLPGWRRVRLGDILALRKEVVHPRDNPCGPARFVGLEHIESGTGQRVGVVEIEKSELTGRKPQFRCGDIVYGYLRPYLNKVWLADFDGLCSVDQYVYSIDAARASKDYVAWFMRSPVYLERAPIDLTPGQLPRIRTEEVASVEIELPALNEQTRIAAVINEQMATVEKARAAVEAQLEAARNLPAAYLRVAFNSPEARAWPRKKLREVCETDGQYGTSQKSDGAGLPVLRMGNLVDGRLHWDNLAFVSLPPAEADKYRLVIGDLLFNRTNSAELVGKTAVFDGSREAIFASYLVRFRTAREVCLPEFVCAYINSAHGRTFIAQNMARAIGQVNISASTMHRMPIPTPPVGEQARIVAALSERTTSADSVCKSVEAKLSAINALPAAILRRAFSGGL